MCAINWSLVTINHELLITVCVSDEAQCAKKWSNSIAALNALWYMADDNSDIKSTIYMLLYRVFLIAEEELIWIYLVFVIFFFYFNDKF